MFKHKAFVFAIVMLALLLSGLVAVAQETEEPAEALPVIIDTDMALDDWMAILFLLQHPGANVLAVTVTGAGEAHCEPGVAHALELVALAGQPEVPVACGRETPLASDHAFPDWLRDSVDNLAGLELPPNPTPPFDGSAVDLLTQTLQDSEEPVTIVTLGPLTNLAEAFEAEPSLIDQIAMIYVMGGAVDVGGNVAFMVDGNNAAEANIYVDPQAAASVIASGAPITFVPLDATNHVPITMAFYDQIAGDDTTPEAEFVYQALTSQVDFIRSGGYYFWDPLAAAIAVDESLATLEARHVSVITDEGPTSGQTINDEDGDPVRVAVAADGDRFKEIFWATLNGRAVE